MKKDSENKRSFPFKNKEKPETGSPRYPKRESNSPTVHSKGSEERNAAKGEKSQNSFDERNSRFYSRKKGEKRPRIVKEKDIEIHNEEQKKSDQYFTSKPKQTYREKKSEFSGINSGRPDKKQGFFKGKRKETSLVSDDGTVRLNRYIAHAGVCSRRQADEYIKAGLVTVNDQLITELGTKVIADVDIVKFNNETLRPQKFTYILLNKPKNYITTTDDPESRQTVLDLVKDAGSVRVFPVGRLDRNTTGVLLITNDGELTTRLTHPKFNIKKIYEVELDKNLKSPDLEKLLKGIELEDGYIKVDSIDYPDPSKKNIVGIEIHSGRNLIIRRMFDHLGYQVIKLDRVLFAGLTKKNLSRGKWRFLSEKEIAFLKMGKFE